MMLIPRSTTLIASVILGLAAAVPTHAQKPGVWGDLGNGSYANPVIPADFSDLDVIRVGDEFIAMSSTFQYSPGVVLLSSKDLVNWRIVSHAVPDVRQISPEMNWDRMGRYGTGVWAGAIRHHAGKFWVYFGTPQEGYFMTTAPAVAGPWEPLTRVLKSPGWDDCCPFWDDDGQMYLVGSQFARDPATRKTYNVHLWKLTPDGKAFVPGSDRIIHQSNGSEANKLYKMNGFYYHFYSEVRGEGRVVMMNRSKSLDGPWEKRQVNHAQRNPTVDPNQGGLIELSDKSWWFFTHLGSGTWAGRTAHLLPVKWVEGWPILGEPGPDGIGNMVWQARKPITDQRPAPRVFVDEFSTPQLAPEWEWNHHPRADQWSLTERPGFLRLHAFRPLQRDNLLKVGNCLTQRIYASASGQVTVKLDVSRLADGQNAGLCFFSRTSGWIGAVRQQVKRDGQSSQINVVQVEQGKRTIGPVLTGTELWVRAAIDVNGCVTWAYATDAKTFSALGCRHQSDWANYRGTRIGLFTYDNEGQSGIVDFDSFTYTY